MPGPANRRDRATLGLAVAILALMVSGMATAAIRVVERPAAIRAEGAGLGRLRPAAKAAVRVANPARVRIPAIGVDATLMALGLNDDGSLAVPPYELAGWYGLGPRPGEKGRSVIAAHVDSLNGPAVFFRLKEVKAGDEVTVDYDDGTAVRFLIEGSESYAKTEFPTSRVYGPSANPQLRLITCGGTFDRRAGSYRDNLVVWASAAPGSTAV